MVNLVSIYQSDTLNQREYDYFFETASLYRKEKATKFLHRQDACRTLVAGALVRYCFERFYSTRICEGNIIQNQFGKPLIANSFVHFNISHSDEWVVCAVDSNGEIGVDIEKHHKIDLQIAERFFSHPEQELIKQCDADDRIAKFSDIWVLKESYIKAIGKGLYCDLNSFACLPSPDRSSVKFIKYDNSLPEKNIKLLNFTEKHSCALCANDVMDINSTILKSEELMQALISDNYFEL